MQAPFCSDALFPLLFLNKNNKVVAVLFRQIFNCEICATDFLSKNLGRYKCAYNIFLIKIDQEINVYIITQIC
jgi:hypothetical protein